MTKAGIFLDNRDRDQVERSSRSCPHCDGGGITVAYHPLWSEGPSAIDDSGRRIATRVACHCQCDAGLWVRERVRPEQQRRIPRVADILAGSSAFLLDPPAVTREYAS